MTGSNVEIVGFLRGVQSAREQMREVWNHFTQRGLKVHWGDQHHRSSLD